MGLSTPELPLQQSHLVAFQLLFLSVSLLVARTLNSVSVSAGGCLSGYGIRGTSVAFGLLIGPCNTLGYT